MKRLLPWLAGALFAMPTTVWATDNKPLGLDEAAELALATQPRLQARAHAAEGLRQAAIAAGELPDPNLRLGVMSLPLESFSFTEMDMTLASIGVMQMIPGGNKRALERIRMEREAGMADVSQGMARRQIRRETRRAWLEVYMPERTLALLRELDDEYARQLDWAAVAFKTDRIGRDDTLMWRVERERLQDRVAEQEGMARRARAGLARWLDATAARPLAELARVEVPELPRLEAGLEKHPELAEADAATQVAEADVDLAREASKPDWTVEVAYGLRGADRSDLLSVQVGVDLPLFKAKRQDRRLAMRQAELDQAKHTREDVRRGLLADLRAAHADWQSANVRIERYENSLLPLAQARIDNALVGYRVGKTEFAAVSAARREALDVRMQLLALRVAQARAAVELDYFKE
jgi:outer membrane protein, heavy metal efflux system